MKRWLPIAAILLCLLPRFADLQSDPPQDLGESGGYYADEGYWTHNARNMVLFGRAVTDEWNNMYASPLTHWPAYLSFRLFGVGLLQARLIPVLLSGFSVLLLAYGLPGSAAIWGVVLFSCNGLLIQFGRLSLIEAPLIFLLLAAWASISPPNPSLRRYFFTGLALGLAVGTKLTVVYVVPAAVLAILIHPGETGTRRALIAMGSGLVLAVLLWLLMIGSNVSLFLQYLGYYGSQQAPWLGRLFDNITHPELLSNLRSLPLMLGLGLVMVAGLISLKRLRAVPRLVVFAAAWFGFGALYLSTLTYNPLRYHIPLLPALIIVIAWCADEVFNHRLPLRWSLPGVLFIFLFVYHPAWDFAESLRPGLRGWSMIRRLVLFLCSLGGFLVLWRLVARIFEKWNASRYVVTIVLLVSVIIQVLNYMDWFQSRSHEIRDTSRMLGLRFENATFTGQWAPVLCMENTHRFVPVWPGFVNGEQPFQRYKITHGLIWERHWERFVNWFPGEFSTAAILDTLRIKNSAVVLCGFSTSASNTQPSLAREDDRPIMYEK